MVEQVFADRRTAEQTVQNLINIGVERTQITIDVQREEVMYAPGAEETLKAQNEVGFSWLGGAIGIAFGLIVVAATPDLGVRFKLSSVVTVTACYFFGSFVGGRIGRRFRFGYRGKEEEAPFESGRIVVTVNSPDKEEKVRQILFSEQQRKT